MTMIKRLLAIINPMNWSGRTLLIVGAAVLLVTIIGMIEPIARKTILKDFYQDVDVAAEYSEKLKFDHYVTTIQSNEGEFAGRGARGGWHYDNCGTMGTYHNNQTNTTMHNAFTCSVNFKSFYWLDNLDANTIHQARQDMLSQGWSEVGAVPASSVDDHIREIQNQGDGHTYGFTFKHSDTINASLVFFTRGSDDYDSWCRSFKAGCGPFEKRDSTHQNIMVIDVSARKYFE